MNIGLKRRRNSLIGRNNLINDEESIEIEYKSYSCSRFFKNIKFAEFDENKLFEEIKCNEKKIKFKEKNSDIISFYKSKEKLIEKLSLEKFYFNKDFNFNDPLKFHNIKNFQKDSSISFVKSFLESKKWFERISKNSHEEEKNNKNENHTQDKIIIQYSNNSNGQEYFEQINNFEKDKTIDTKKEYKYYEYDQLNEKANKLNIIINDFDKKSKIVGDYLLEFNNKFQEKIEGINNFYDEIRKFVETKKEFINKRLKNKYESVKDKIDEIQDFYKDNIEVLKEFENELNNYLKNDKFNLIKDFDKITQKFEIALESIKEDKIQIFKSEYEKLKENIEKFNFNIFNEEAEINNKEEVFEFLQFLSEKLKFNMDFRKIFETNINTNEESLENEFNRGSDDEDKRFNFSFRRKSSMRKRNLSLKSEKNIDKIGYENTDYYIDNKLYDEEKNNKSRLNIKLIEIFQKEEFNNIICSSSIETINKPDDEKQEKSKNILNTLEIKTIGNNNFSTTAQYSNQFSAEVKEFIPQINSINFSLMNNDQTENCDIIYCHTDRNEYQLTDQSVNKEFEVESPENRRYKFENTRLKNFQLTTKTKIKKMNSFKKINLKNGNPEINIKTKNYENLLKNVNLQLPKDFKKRNFKNEINTNISRKDTTKEPIFKLKVNKNENIHDKQGIGNNINLNLKKNLHRYNNSMPISQMLEKKSNDVYKKNKIESCRSINKFEIKNNFATNFHSYKNNIKIKNFPMKKNLTKNNFSSEVEKNYLLMSSFNKYCLTEKNENEIEKEDSQKKPIELFNNDTLNSISESMLLEERNDDREKIIENLLFIKLNEKNDDNVMWKYKNKKWNISKRLNFITENFQISKINNQLLYLLGGTLKINSTKDMIKMEKYFNKFDKKLVKNYILSDGIYIFNLKNLSYKKANFNLKIPKINFSSIYIEDENKITNETEKFLFIAGGETMSNQSLQISKSFDYYDLNLKKWVQLSPLIHPRKDGNLINTENGFLYLIGGSSENEIALQSIHGYDLNNLMWHEYKNMNFKRKKFSCLYYEGFIYVFGGLNDKNLSLNSCEKYDIILDEWINIESMKFNRFSSCCFVSDEINYIYVVGGENINSVDINNKNKSYNVTSIERYDILHNLWEDLAELPNNEKYFGKSYILKLN